MKIAICDDDIALCGKLEEIINKFGQEKSIAIECENFANGKDLLTHSGDSYAFQIYLLDIEMEGMDGFELARRVREKNEQAVIIFVTSHKEMMQEAFEVRAFHYIVKPFEQQEVERIIGNAVRYINRTNKIFFYKCGRKTVSVLFQNIYYFESSLRKVKIVTSTGEECFYSNLKKIRNELDEKLFVQVHTSYIVNMEHIQTKTNREVQLDSGDFIPVSQKYCSEFNEKYYRYVQMRTGR